MKRSLYIILSFGLLMVLFIQVLFVSQNSTFAQDSGSDEEIYAVSNLGEKVDFKALASEIAKAKDPEAFAARQIPPFIPAEVSK